MAGEPIEQKHLIIYWIKTIVYSFSILFEKRQPANDTIKSKVNNIDNMAPGMLLYFISFKQFTGYKSISLNAFFIDIFDIYLLECRLIIRVFCHK